MKAAAVPLLFLPLLAAMFVVQNAHAALINSQVATRTPATLALPTNALLPVVARAGTGNGARLALELSSVADDFAPFEQDETIPGIELYGFGDAVAQYKLDAIITESKAVHFYDFEREEHELEERGRDEAFWGYVRLVAIPEPATGALLAVGLLGLLLVRRNFLRL